MWRFHGTKWSKKVLMVQRDSKETNKQLVGHWDAKKGNEEQYW